MKIGKILLAPALALATVSCGFAGGDPAAEGAAAYEAHDYRTARVALAEAMQGENPSAETADLYVRTLLALGDGESAQRVIDMLQDQGTAPTDVLALSAHAASLREEYELAISQADAAPAALGEWAAIRALGELERTEEAFARADAALETYPHSAMLLALRGGMALSQLQVNAAKDYSTRALAADGENLEALMLAGQLRAQRSDHEGALEFYARAHEAHPSDIGALFALAAVEADLGRLEDAQGRLESIFAVAPGHPMALLLEAKIAFVEGDLDEAHAVLQSGESAIGRIPQGRLLMGEVAYLRGFPAQAMGHFERFLGMQPGHVHATTVLARILQEEGRTRDAWDRVAPLADSATATPQMLALASHLAEELGEEDRFAARLGDARPESFATNARAAQEALMAGDNAEALRLYTALIEQGGDNDAVILNNAAMAAVRNGETGRAVTFARQAHELAPRDPRVDDTLGWALLENGNRSEGLRHLTDAYQAQPGNLQIRWHYANALIANGRNSEARTIISEMREFASADQREAMDALLARL
ncbi:tetratricopeptide repeat protein [Aurantiacibacter gangjinensis]|uniref:Uncharacterized protein n=1 Tax=Aurantiacibacter gangjinensis TaxID=502682 RepID=A0A0G9MPX6_9SPHN|nr:tetratricopeptide repeat protein [Aurantiacibacter gangjinensis]APE27243.1 TPR repeat protein [Aurantiacibacter gangjinensis]KLE31363.1 hypothetical protein AAW01_07085 [Aurantiacibacter gangjinensis]